MKKMMVAAFAAMGMAVCANASSVQWAIGSGDYTDHDGNAIEGTGTGFLYVLTGETAAPTWSKESGWNMNGAILAATSAWSDDLGGWGAPEWVDGGAAVVAGTTEGAEQQYFALILTEASGVTDLNGYEGYVNFVNTSIQGVQDVVDPTTPTYGVTINDWETPVTQGGWVNTQASVTPEPTSGLLLLLGVAGLTLRRRRA